MITRAPGTKPGRGSSLIRLDPQYRQTSRHIEYPPEDFAELDALCKRPVDTPRSLLSPEQIKELLKQPEKRSKFSHPAKLRKAQMESRTGKKGPAAQ